MRKKNQYFRILFVFTALLTTDVFSQALGADHYFNGSWIYEQTCGWRHVASIELHQRGSQVEGDWSDGSARASGTSGQLKGNVSGKKLTVRYCGIDENSDSNICPSFDSETSDYFIREGVDLIWYKMSTGKNGVEFKKYLVLHPAIGGKPSIKDSDCPSE